MKKANREVDLLYDCVIRCATRLSHLATLAKLGWNRSKKGIKQGQIKVLILLTLMCLVRANSQAVADYPEVGRPIPSFELKDVEYFSSKQFNINDLRGKWVILDFFALGCVSCFESLPKMNKMAEKFAEKVEVIMVGKYHPKLRDTYEKFRTRLKLNLPVAYDSTLVKRFGIEAFPVIIVIDENSVVRGVTSSLTQENIETFLKGNTPNLTPSFGQVANRNKSSQLYDHTKPLLINGNGGADTTFLFRSVLTKWNNDIAASQYYYVRGYSSINEKYDYLRGRVQAIRMTAEHLYQMAYSDTLRNMSYVSRKTYESFWHKPILEVKDSLELKKRYNYSLIVPKGKGSAKFLQAAMRRDLETYFGYKAELETRMMPYWGLRSNSKSKKRLKSKGKSSEPREVLPRTGLSLKNIPVSRLIDELCYYKGLGAPFIDETDIDYNIDIDVEAILTDFEDFKEGLKKAGIELVRGKKEMKVVVIKDGN